MFSSSIVQITFIVGIALLVLGFLFQSRPMKRAAFAVFALLIVEILVLGFALNAMNL